MRPLTKITIILMIVTLGFCAIFIILSSRNEIYSIESFNDSDVSNDSKIDTEPVEKNKSNRLKEAIKQLSEMEGLYLSPRMVDTSTGTPKEKADRAYIRADMMYTLSDYIEDIYKNSYYASKDAYDLIATLYGIAESKDKDKFNALIESGRDISERKVYAIIDVYELDVSDIIADTTSFVFEKVKYGDWDYSHISKNKNYIQKAVNDQIQKMKKTGIKWSSQRKKSEEYLAKRSEAFDTWKNIKDKDE